MPIKFEYKLVTSQEEKYPAFYEKHLTQSGWSLKRNELNKAVEQLNQGADIILYASEDQGMLCVFVHELTFRATRIVKLMDTPSRKIPGHLFIFFPDKPVPQKVW